jgi:hypothetical protein
MIKQNKTKYLTLRVSTDDIKTIKAIKHHYKAEGINLNISKIVRDVILHFPIE